MTQCSPLIGRQSPLHLAAMNGLAAVTETLLQNRADTGAANKVKHYCPACRALHMHSRLLNIPYMSTRQIGQTPLIYAVLEEQVAVVELLVAAGADVNKGNPLHSNWAPIHWAALTDNTQV